MRQSRIKKNPVYRKHALQRFEVNCESQTEKHNGIESRVTSDERVDRVMMNQPFRRRMEKVAAEYDNNPPGGVSEWRGEWPQTIRFRPSLAQQSGCRRFDEKCESVNQGPIAE